MLELLSRPGLNPVKRMPQAPKLRPTHILLLSALLALLLLSVLPSPSSLYDAYTHPACGHIVLVSAARHGSTWLLSNAENCASTNRTPLSNAEIWGHTSDLALDEALDLVRSRTSVKIFPEAFYKQALNVRDFLRYAKAERHPVFVLRRSMPDSWESLKAGRDFQNSSLKEYMTETTEYFTAVNKLLRQVGLRWDTFNYDVIKKKQWIYGPANDCYIRNCHI